MAEHGSKEKAGSNVEGVESRKVGGNSKYSLGGWWQHKKGRGYESVRLRRGKSGVNYAF